MRCPTLSELPPPPLGKTGWPWTEQTPPLPDLMPDGAEWPRISIVTPSYNQGEFIEETIRSVLLQGYPNLEYIIIDGGSTDNSVDVIKKYSSRLTYWVSERDEGQSDALNKGFNICSGEIGAYLNSDDIFMQSAISKVALYYSKARGFKWLASKVIAGESVETGMCWKPKKATFPRFVVAQTFGQAGVFWKTNVRPRPYFDINKQFGMDHNFFVEIYRQHGSPKIMMETTAFFRQHPGAKTSRLTEIQEKEKQEIIAEIEKKVDNETAGKIRKEELRRKAILRISKLLGSLNGSLKEKWKSVGEAIEIITTAPDPLRDRIFISALVRLLLRLFVVEKFRES